ncbi:PELOTA RNA binding domain-containing protein [Caminicella sporogenes DSM 14501]|uniref:PELOTA RNA binding domain-containing protein n=1 Tax=Caminicella sporogenes DSM 14501 TaxID=1121266 RepID=A0A1M6QL34_9FIRM|nr:cysteine protease StiP family protein [Caminicella sporogenes]SHK20962.1 PELOTA RNA binding domain-containing protein [Caminicella sporogenes DSM 14501]
MTSSLKKFSLREPDIMGSYSKNDVIFLLKDISDMIEEKDNDEREKAIQSGVHYSEMLPIEYRPSEEYIKLFYESLKKYDKKIATAVGVVGELILKKRGKDIVLASLARAGTPIGILIKRYIKYKYKLDLPHYSISIIRGKGIDESAIKYILLNHPGKEIQFIDGWTGKGAITKVLQMACKDFKKKWTVELNDDLAVLADPGYCVSTFGTREDFLIPSACLNSTVSGLVSRTVHREDLIKEDDFHGAKFYKELIDEDLSNFYVDTISSKFKYVLKDIEENLKEILNKDSTPTWLGLKDVEKIQRDFNIENINFVKPGIGETTRVLLRRIPWKILIRKDSKNLEHILLLAKERNVPVEVYPLKAYNCCGIIKNLRRE